MSKKNLYKVCGNYIVATTSNGTEFYVSLQDEWIFDYRCFSTHSNANGNLYLKCKVNNKRVFLHNLLRNPPQGYLVDHINGNTLDNRRENLRVCTKAENMINRKTYSSNQINQRGISLTKDGAYVVRICKEKKSIYLGRYKTLEEAKEVREKAEQELFGEFRRV